MKAEFGIDPEGKAYICLSALSQSEWNMAQYLKPFLPIRMHDMDGEVFVRGDRLPGSVKDGS